MTGYVTIFESPSLLAKRWKLDERGEPIKSTAAQMTRGSYRVAEFSSVAEAVSLLTGITTHQALSCSLPLDGSAAGEVVTKGQLYRSPKAKARSKSHFAPVQRPGLMLLDHDSGGLTRDELWQLLVRLVPELLQAGVIWRPSGSSHIFHGERDMTGLRGQHLYVMVADASDGARVLKVIADRLWLAGHGYIRVSESGCLLERCPIDLAVGDAARLIFAGGAECVPPLEQRSGPPVVISDGGFLDTRKLVPKLADAEAAKVLALKVQAKAAREGEARERRAEHRAATIARRVPQLMRMGISAAEAERRIGAAVDAAYGGILLSDFELTAVVDGEHVLLTVGEVLADRLRWHEVDFLDPLNPGHRGGAPDARAYLTGAWPNLYSFDDGGRVYRLRAQQVRLEVANGARSDLVTGLARVIAACDDIFMTDAGPVLLDQGKQYLLTPERIMRIVGREAVLTMPGKGGTSHPVDLKRDVAVLVLVELLHVDQADEVTA